MAAKNTYQPSLTGIPKRSLDRLLHYLAMQQIKSSKKPRNKSLSIPIRHPHFLFQYHKNFRLISRLKGQRSLPPTTQEAGPL